MKKHSLSYFDLNPKPTAFAMLGKALKYLASLLWALAVVYGLTVLLFSF